jgi:hypothetical protein
MTTKKLTIHTNTHWDPASIEKKNLEASNFKIGHSERGRDGRVWVVFQDSKDGTYKWRLHPDERVSKYYKPSTTTATKNKTSTKSLIHLGWWRWSTIPNVHKLIIEECGAAGDCMFKVLSYALFKTNSSHYDLRRHAALQIGCSNSVLLLQHENQERKANNKSRNEYGWNPNKLLSKEVKCCERKYEQLGFILLTDDGVAYPEFIEADSSTSSSKTRYVIILYHVNGNHWRLVTMINHKKEQVTMFNIRHLPTPISSILKSSWGRDWRKILGISL